MKPIPTDPTPIRPTAEIIAFPAGGRSAYRATHTARQDAATLEATAREANVPMIRGCWYHDDAINEVDVASPSH